MFRCCMYTKQKPVSKDLQKSLTSNDVLSQSIHGEYIEEESTIQEEAIVVEKCSFSTLLDMFCCKTSHKNDKKVRFEENESKQDTV